ncbi:ImuA family protein [Azospirillum aestuarii]|uniref:ImuA family protein n=1 Tax=Azospirillum aestuarii TaxID=2802052 RepID=UPI004054BDE2
MPDLSMPIPQSFEASSPDRAAVLADLRARIRGLEGLGGEGARVLPFGLPDLDGAFPAGGLPLGCLHEVAEEEPGAGTAFAAHLLARLASTAAPALWVVRGRDLHAAGLAAYGLTPDRLIAVRATRDADALWAMEEALRCKRLSAVLGEVGGLDLTASRRLQLAAESSGVTGFLLQSTARRSAASAAVTRWRIAPAPSWTAEPGVGDPRWRAELERCRGGRPGAWLVEWRDGALVPTKGPERAIPAPASTSTPVRRPVPVGGHGPSWAEVA